MGIPQILMIIWLALGFAGGVFYHGETTQIKFGHTIFVLSVYAGLMIWGGFFQ